MRFGYLCPHPQLSVGDIGACGRRYNMRAAAALRLRRRRETVAASEAAFKANGGLKDRVQISVGHGPKIRVWDYFGPFYNCPALRERVGKIGDGGKWVCGVRAWLQRPSCVVYSIGSKGEVSFEKGVVAQTKCSCHTFDPTLTEEQKRAVLAVPGVQFHNVGLGAADGTLEIEEEGSGKKGRRLHWVQKTKASYPVKTLTSLMADLGHQWVDVLKVDIEGGEWDVFRGLMAEGMRTPFTQLQIELHFLGSVPGVLEFFEGMKRHGFRVFSVEPNYYGRTPENARTMIEYSLIKVNKYGDVVTGPELDF